jgi:hypothetical protein
MTKLLIEILSEEIPARMIPEMRYKIGEALSMEFASDMITFEAMEVYDSPRRLGYIFHGLSSNCSIEEIKGPKITAPMEAIDGFLRKYKLDDAPFALVPSPTGVNIINFALPNDVFQKEVKAISNNLGATKNDIRYALGSNEYIPQDWQNQGLLGKSNYVKNIENIEQSRKGAGLYSAFDKVSPGLAAKINDIDKQFGFELSPYIMTLRQAIADNGIAGLREIIKKGALPAVLVAEITPFLNDQPMD